MTHDTLRIAATGALSLALATGVTACAAIPTEGSGEVQEMKEMGQGVAEEVEKTVQDRMDEIPETSPLREVTQYENVAADSIRVITGETLDDAQRDALANDVFTYGAANNDALVEVQVRDASGEETTHSR